MNDGTRIGAGLAAAIGAYLLWGFLPLYFLLLAPTGAVEVVAWRVVLSLVFCLVLITVLRSWRPFLALWRDRSTIGWLALASVLIAINWIVYVYATLGGHIVEASLGYFINPIVSVLLGVLVLRERLRPMQWIAVGVSGVAVVVLVVGYGAFPWVALTLAFSFGLYGLMKNRVGGRVDAIGGLAVETAVLSPLAIAVLAVVAATSGLTMGANGALHTGLLLSAGIITAVPLLLFAAAARRLPLTYIGLAQFLAPVIQFIVGVAIVGEPMPLERWIGFGIVWVALVILAADMVIHGRRSSKAIGEARSSEVPVLD